MNRNPLLKPSVERRIVLLIASGTLALAGAACAQTSPPPTPATAPSAETDRDVAAAFRAADKNSDGQLNREESLLMPSVWRHFDQIDVNKDNNISLDELTKAVQY